MITSPLDRAINLLREAQQILDADYPVLAAHVETAIGLAIAELGENGERSSSAA